MEEDITQKRLYIGGLFPDVSESELKSRFGKYGCISSVDITIRKDENGVPVKTFAHMDIAATEKSLQNCFSLYNNTKWKGSELKLQIAKEHFLTRLQKERKVAQHLEPVPETLVPPVFASPLSDVAGFTDFCMKGGVPGSEIPGVKDWVVGKYGRVLPVVSLRRKGQKRLLKVDPSKYVHHVKKIRVDDSFDNHSSVNSLTWDLETHETEISKRMQGKFPDWKPKPQKRFVPESVPVDHQWKLESEMELEVVPTGKVMMLHPAYLTNRKTYNSDSDEQEETNRQDSKIANTVAKLSSVEMSVASKLKELRKRTNEMPISRAVGHRDSELSLEHQKNSHEANLGDHVESTARNVAKLSSLGKKVSVDSHVKSSSVIKNIVKKRVKETEKQKEIKNNIFVERKNVFSQQPRKLMEFRGTKMLKSESDKESIKNSVIIKMSENRIPAINQSTDIVEEMSDNQSVSSADTDEILTSFHSKDQVSSQKPFIHTHHSNMNLQIDYMNEYSSGFQACVGKRLLFHKRVLSDSEDDDNDFEKTVKKKCDSHLHVGVNSLVCVDNEGQIDDFELEGEQKIASGNSPKPTARKTGNIKKNNTPTIGDDQQKSPVMLQKFKQSSVVKAGPKSRKNKTEKEKEDLRKPFLVEESTDATSSVSAHAGKTSDTTEISGSVKQINNLSNIQFVDAEDESGHASVDSADADEFVMKLKSQNAFASQKKWISLSEVVGIGSVSMHEFSSGMQGDGTKMKFTTVAFESGSYGTGARSEDMDSEYGDSDFEVFVKKQMAKSRKENINVRKDSNKDNDNIKDKAIKVGTKLETKLRLEVSQVPIMTGETSKCSSENDNLDTKHVVIDSSLSSGTVEDAMKQKMKNDADDRVSVDKKRQEAIKLRLKENQAQKSLITKALASVDTDVAQNKKIVFEDSEDEDSGTNKTDMTANTQETVVHVQTNTPVVMQSKCNERSTTLFGDCLDEESTEDEDEDKNRFKLRPEFEGKAGKKLLNLQSQYDTDERFRLDTRFKDSDSEGGENEEEMKTDEDEKLRSLKILQSVVGKKLKTNTEHKKTFKDIAALRFDPTDEVHSQFEIKPLEVENVEDIKSEKEKEGKKEEEEEKVEPVISKVSKERFFEVSSSIKEVFGKKEKSENNTATGEFSLLAAFGKVGTEDLGSHEEEESYSYKPITKTEGAFTFSDRFRTESSSNEGSDQEDKYSQRVATEVEEKIPLVFTSQLSSFFFTDDDSRLKEGQSFCRKEDLDTVRKQWTKQRPQLISDYRKKHKNLRRKKTQRLKAAKGKKK